MICFISYTPFNPYGQILENSSKYFSKIPISVAWHGPISGKLIHFFFKLQISGVWQILENSSKYFSNIPISVAWPRLISGKLIQRPISGTGIHFFKISISGLWNRPLSGKFIQSQILELWGMTETDYWKTHSKRGFSRQEICNEFWPYKFMDEFSRNRSG